jgi:hypothetical protein
MVRALFAVSLVGLMLLAGCGGTSGGTQTPSPAAAPAATTPAPPPAEGSDESASSGGDSVESPADLGHVTGTVVHNTNGLPLAGVVVTAYVDGDSNGAPDYPYQPADRARTYPSGGYDLRLHAGTYVITYDKAADGIAELTGPTITVVAHGALHLPDVVL